MRLPAEPAEEAFRLLGLISRCSLPRGPGLRGLLDSRRPRQLVLRSMDRVAARTSRRRESPAFLHFRRFLAHPVRLSSALPVSRAVARMVASKVEREDGEYVVELGSGTGAVTRALLEAGVPAGKLIAVEIDSEMAASAGSNVSISAAEP